MASTKKRVFGDLTNAELRAELKKRGARVGGNKDALVQRLEDYDRNNNFMDETDKENETNGESNLRHDWPDNATFTSVSQSSRPPDLNTVHINTYFLRQYVSGFGLSAYEAANSKGFQMCRTKFLAALTECRDEKNSIIFYRGQVHSEMTKTLTYFNYIGVHPDGNLVQSKCECVTGDGPAAVCKHVAVVCYAIAHFNDTGKWLIRETVTQKKQVWHAPKNARLNESPKKVEHLTLAVQKQGSEVPESFDLCFDPRRKPSTPVDYNARARAAIISYTNHTHTNLGISTIYAVASTKAIIKDHDYLKTPLEQQVVFNRIKVTQEQADLIELLSRNQAGSKVWWTEKSFRVTASKVGEICHFTDRRDKERYAHDLVFNNNRTIASASLLHGRINEPNAIKAFENDTSNSVMKCGTFVSIENPFIAGSPDGKVARVSLLEVKCPYSIRDEVVTAENYPHLERRDNRLYLKRSSNYYYQVQTQLYCAKKDHCFFYVWTFRGGVWDMVDRDDKFISEEIIPLVREFYYEYMIPQISKKLLPLL